MTHCIYGDPVALRRLADVLIKLADIDQSTLSDAELPENEGLHWHIPAKNVIKNSAALVIGRADAKGNGGTQWVINGLVDGEFEAT